MAYVLFGGLIIFTQYVAKIEAACDISNCLTCDDGDTSCTICSEGYFLFEDSSCRACEHTCKANASSTLSTCKQADGYCEFGCSVGFYGDRCTSPCSSTCKAQLCDRSNGRCTHGCKLQSFMGDSCLAYCPTGCSDGTCTQDGDCLNQCKPNYYDVPGCDKNCDVCSQNTSEPQARKCDLDTGACIHGCSGGNKWGTYCNYTCSIGCEDQLCDFNTGHCTGNCQNTTVWGVTCDYSCSSNCHSAECHKDNGTCVAGCTDNTTWGAYCNKTCPSGCEGILCNANTSHCIGNCQNTTIWGDTCDIMCSSNCLNAECNENNGTCLKGCTGNTTWGPYCNKTCPSGCEGNLCNTNTGHCTGKCQNATIWGDTCDNACSSDCFDNKCDKDNGTCIAGCTDNTTWGPRCNKKCPSGCEGNMCNASTGHCSGFCQNTTIWGDTCDNACSSDCFNNKCDKDNGTCIAGCTDNTTWGPRCKKTCPSGCEGNLCNTNTGHCTGKCQNTTIWGDTCDNACSSDCFNNKCNKDNGTCIAGCTDNTTWGPRCNKTCPSGCEGNMCNASTGHCSRDCQNTTVWGDTCDNLCSSKCLYDECNKDNGTCLVGCTGNKPSSCNKSDALADEAREKLSSNLIVYISVSCGIVILVAGIVAVAIKTKYRKVKPVNENEEDITAVSKDWTNNLPIRGVNAMKTLFDNRMLQRGLTQTLKRRQTTIKSTNRFEVKNMLSVVLNMKKSELEAEFKSLAMEYTRSYEVAPKSENCPRNTYPGLYPYDDIRLSLQQETKTDTSYINASYIKGFDGQRRYIAAQGPSRLTNEDFWKMVWMDDVKFIVMLNGSVKSELNHIYLPDSGSAESFGNISVYGGTSENYADFVSNSCNMKRGDVEKHVTHLQFTAWEEGFPPNSACSLIEFHQKYRSIVKGHTNPRTVVHCTNGVGRTGVFIALDILTETALSDDHVDILACVTNMRDQRIQMVQTQDQYEFLYKVVAQTLCLQCQLIPVKEFGHHGIDIEEQFQKCNDSLDLDTVKIPTFTFEQEVSRKKGTSKENSGALYNAQNLSVTVSDTYRHKDGMIMTQSPGADLAVDFCGLVMKTKCSVILKLNDVEMNKQSFLPKLGCSKMYGRYQVATVSVKDLPAHIEIQLKFKTKKKKRTQSLYVKMLQYKGWTDANELPPPSDLFRMDNVVREHMDRYPGRPLLVQCLDGVTQSGLFCAVHDISEKLLTETEISVVNTVRKLKGKAGNAIPSLEQFKLCYDAVCSYKYS